MHFLHRNLIHSLSIFHSISYFICGSPTTTSLTPRLSQNLFPGMSSVIPLNFHQICLSKIQITSLTISCRKKKKKTPHHGIEGPLKSTLMNLLIAVLSFPLCITHFSLNTPGDAFLLGLLLALLLRKSLLVLCTLPCFEITRLATLLSWVNFSMAPHP